MRKNTAIFAGVLIFVMSVFVPGTETAVTEAWLEKAEIAGAAGLGRQGADIMGCLGEADEVCPYEIFGIDVYVYEITDSPNINRVFYRYEKGVSVLTGLGYNKNIVPYDKLREELLGRGEIEPAGEREDGLLAAFQTKREENRVYITAHDAGDETVLCYMTLPFHKEALQ